jgi:poly(beta-D-mannuronate) lyase
MHLVLPHFENSIGYLVKSSKMTPRVSRLTGAECLFAVIALDLTANAALACSSPPPPVRDLNVPHFYKARLDPKLQVIAAAELKPLNGYLNFVTSQADRSLTAPTDTARADAGRCAGEWLAAWAEGEAWLGRMGTRQSEYRRKWDLAGLAIAYLKVKTHVTSEQRASIEPWLDRIATAARAFFDDDGRQRNNHWYWLGLGLAATGLATGDERHWAEARRIMADAANDIRADGTLPLELARGSRALHYHAFSATPLVVLAEMGAARGEDWYGLGDGALHRLIGLTVAGLRNPALFARLAGQAQESSHSAYIRSLPLYDQRFPGRNLLEGMPKMPTEHHRLGGDVMLLRGLLASEPTAGEPLAMSTAAVGAGGGTAGKSETPKKTK